MSTERPRELPEAEIAEVRVTYKPIDFKLDPSDLEFISSRAMIQADMMRALRIPWTYFDPDPSLVALLESRLEKPKSLWQRVTGKVRWWTDRVRGWLHARSDRSWDDD